MLKWALACSILQAEYLALLALLVSELSNFSRSSISSLLHLGQGGARDWGSARTRHSFIIGNGVAQHTSVNARECAALRQELRHLLLRRRLLGGLAQGVIARAATPTRRSDVLAVSQARGVGDDEDRGPDEDSLAMHLAWHALVRHGGPLRQADDLVDLL